MHGQTDWLFSKAEEYVKIVNTMSDTPSAPFRLVRRLRILLIPPLLLCLYILLTPFDSIKQSLDAFAPDGSLEMFTFTLHHRLVMTAAIFGGIATLLFALSFRCRRSYETFLHNSATAFRTFPREFKRDTGSFFYSLRRALVNPRWITVALIAILTGGFLVRFALLNRPMEHDESYTVVTWASGSFRYAVSDYHLPNNHIFHTLLVYVVYHLFGKTPLLIRLPAFFSGWLLIPLVFLLGKRLYNERAALLASGLTAFSPFLIDYASNARGYSILACACVALMLLGCYLINQHNRFAWGMVVLTTVVGFFTLPVMLYPFGIFAVWMFLTWLVSALHHIGRPAVYAGFLPALILYSFLAGFLTLLCYLPLLLNSGIGALTNNVFVHPLPQQDFLPTFGSRLQDWLNAFREGLPVIIWGLVLLGNLPALLFHRAMARNIVPIQLAATIWLVPLWLIQRPNLWPRTQIYLLPLVFIWGAAGIVFMLDWLRERVKWKNELLWHGILLIPAVLAGIYQIPRTITIRSQVSAHEQAVQIVRSNPDALKSLLVVAPEDDASIWYYADRYGLPKTIFDRNRPFSTVYVYVNPMNAGFEEPRTLPEVVDRYGPGMAFLDQKMSTLLFERENAVFYRFPANQRLIEETFGIISP